MQFDVSGCTDIGADMNDRIKLAEAMGWKLIELADGTKYWQAPNEKIEGAGQKNPPDPFTDANDCEALIRHLNGQKYDVEIWHSGNGPEHGGRCNVSCRVKVSPTVGPYMREGLACDDWKQGVCELALKVLI